MLLTRKGTVLVLVLVLLAAVARLKPRLGRRRSSPDLGLHEHAQSAPATSLEKLSAPGVFIVPEMVFLGLRHGHGHEQTHLHCLTCACPGLGKIPRGQLQLQTRRHLLQFNATFFCNFGQPMCYDNVGVGHCCCWYTDPLGSSVWDRCCWTLPGSWQNCCIRSTGAYVACAPPPPPVWYAQLHM
jgi:hypothetical protein